MDVMARFKAGVETASRSFYMMWNHKELLIYYGVVATIQLLLTLCTAGMFLNAYSGDGLSRVLHFLTVNVFLQYGHVIIITFLQVAVSIKVASLLQGNTVSVGATVLSAGRKWQPIILWSTINFIMSIVLLRFFHLLPVSMLCMPFAMLGFAWGLFTLFVPIAIALEEISFVEYVQHSLIVVRNYLFKLIGGLSWIGIIFLLLTLPVWFIDKIVPSVHDYFVFICISNVVNSIVLCLISTVTAIFKTKLYVQYKRGIEELQQLQYPRM